jgi:hypothetical protein
LKGLRRRERCSESGVGVDWGGGPWQGAPAMGCFFAIVFLIAALAQG